MDISPVAVFFEEFLVFAVRVKERWGDRDGTPPPPPPPSFAVDDEDEEEEKEEDSVVVVVEVCCDSCCWSDVSNVTVVLSGLVRWGREMEEDIRRTEPVERLFTDEEEEEEKEGRSGGVVVGGSRVVDELKRDEDDGTMELRDLEEEEEGDNRLPRTVDMITNTNYTHKYKDPDE